MLFTITFLVAFVAAAWIASATARRASRRHGGSMNQLTNELHGLIVVRAALGLVFYAALVAWLFDLRAGRWLSFALPTSARWLSVALILPVLVFFGWSFRGLGANYRGGVGLYDAHELVTTGPYRVIRHPIYVSFIAIILLIFGPSANWVLGVSGFLLVASIAAEEMRAQAAKLGDAAKGFRTRD